MITFSGIDAEEKYFSGQNFHWLLPYSEEILFGLMDYDTLNAVST
jgi:hypothetical protein